MKKLFTSLSAITIGILTSQAQTIVTANPQYKTAILEEFTGIHCGYCPEGHVIAKNIENANPGRVVLINIHEGGFATPSGGEPDLRTNWGTPISQQAGVTGYPNGTINRHLFPAYGNSTATGRGSWATMADEIMNEVTPVNVGATSAYNAGNNEFTINVEAFYTSNSPSATNYINVVILQDSILGPQSGGSANPSNYVNGQYVHNHVLRDMVTGQWGQAITSTTAGSLYQNTFTYTLPADINGIAMDPAQCHIAVFVTESQQEIYNGVVIKADGGSDDGDHATYIGPFENLNTAALEGSIGATSSFTFDFSALINGSNDYIFELISNQPGDWNSSYKVNGTTYTNNQTISIAGSSTTNLGIDVTPGSAAAVSSYTLKMTMASDGAAVQEIDVYVISGVTDLIVNGSGSNGSGVGNGAIDDEQLYIDGLNFAANTNFDATGAAGMTLLSDANALGGVNNIYLNVGWTFPSLKDAEAIALQNFLDNGGNLFISGQDIGWDIGSGQGNGNATTQSFMTNYLHAGFASDGNNANNQLTAVSSDNVFGSVSNSTIADVYSGNMYPDEFTLGSGAQAVFNYNGNANKIGGIKFDNSTYKIVFLGIGIEMIQNQAVRNEIIKLSHDWFYGLVSMDEVDFNALLNAHPNPTKNLIHLTLNTNENSQYAVYNISGQVVKSGNVKALTPTLTLDLSDLPIGVYNLTLTGTNGIVNHKNIIKID